MDKNNLIILMIDDEEPAYLMLKAGLSKYCFNVLWEGNHQKEVVLSRIAKDKPDAIVLDIMFRGKNEGKMLLQEIKKSRYKDTPVVMLTNTMKDYKDEDYLGAAFPFAKDVFRMGDMAFADLASQIRNNLEKDDSILPDDKRFGFVVGNTPAMLQACKIILKVAPTDATVLITGETGTGKEMVAKAIKNLSLRKDKPFIAVNCAALPETLFESELFGYETGAHSTANKSKLGRFELADNGTIFFDEIGDIPLPVQVKLLRVLQEKEFERLGGTKTMNFTGRILSATNKNIDEEIKADRFREDLYYRLNLVHIQLPSLRERTDEDFERLYAFFINKFNQIYKKLVSPILNNELLTSFRHYNWPGNVREFENKIGGAIIGIKGNVLLPKDFHFGEPENDSSIFLGNAEEIANKLWEGKLKVDDFGDHTKHKGLKPIVIKLIERWIRENNRRPKRKELADRMGTTDEIMGQILNKCELRLTQFQQQKKV